MVPVMHYKRNNKCLSVCGRGDYISTSDFIIQYYTSTSHHLSTSIISNNLKWSKLVLNKAKIDFCKCT